MDSEIQFSFTISGLGTEPFQERITLRKDGSTDVWIKQISDALRPVLSNIAANEQTDSTKKPEPTPEELATIISQGVASAVQEISRFPVKKSGSSPAELAEIISQGVGSAMQEVVATVGQQIMERQRQVEAIMAKNRPSSPELAEIISQGVGAAMREATVEIINIMPPLPEIPPAGPSAQELAEIISQGVGAAMREAIMAIKEQIAVVSQKPLS